MNGWMDQCIAAKQLLLTNSQADRDGVMNRIHFDESRGPITSYFDIKNLQDEGFMKVGTPCYVLQQILIKIRNWTVTK